MNIKEHYKERLLTSMNDGRYLASQQIKENNMKNINELRAFTNDQLDDPVTRTIAQDQMGRLRKIAADHNANPNKPAGYGDRITTMLRTRGARVGTQNNSVYSLPFSRDDRPVPVSHNMALDSREIAQDDRFKASEYGNSQRRDRRQLAARRREWDSGVAAANKQGFTRPSGITEKNNMMNIKEYYKQILNSEINEKLIGKQHQIDADGNKKINRKDFAIINARKKSAMNEATPAEIQGHQISRLDRIANKFNGGEWGADLSKPRNLRAGKRIANLYKKAGVMGGFRPYSGLAGSDPVMMRADVSPAHPDSIRDANAELKAARGSNRTFGRRVRAFVKRTTGLEEMNQVDEMALTKNAFNTMLKDVKKARRMGDATSGVKSARHWRDEEKKSIALVKALRSPILYDIGPKGGLVHINRLTGSKDPARDLTYAANFDTKVPKAVLRSAKKLADLHGMFYTTHDGNDEVTNPLGKTVAIGSSKGRTGKRLKRRPQDGFIRLSRKVSDGFDQM